MKFQRTTAKLSPSAFHYGRGLALAMDEQQRDQDGKFGSGGGGSVPRLKHDDMLASRMETQNRQAAGRQEAKKERADTTKAVKSKSAQFQAEVPRLRKDVRLYEKTARAKDVAKDASVDEVEQFYQRLRNMPRAEIEKLVAGRLDPGHLKSEPRSTLVLTALNDRFSRSVVEAWGANAPTRTRAMDAEVPKIEIGYGTGMDPGYYAVINGQQLPTVFKTKAEAQKAAKERADKIRGGVGGG